jgi:hypothetical protein
MATTWTQINTEIGVLLEDPGMTSYNEELRKNCLNRAMEYFAVTHTALLKTQTATANTSNVIAYPEDFIDAPDGCVEVSWKDKSRWLQEEEILQGSAVPKEGYVAMHNGLFLFTKEYDSLKLWYFAKYPNVTIGSSQVMLPAWSQWAVINLACSYMLYPGMMNQQMLRQFQNRRDAGSPEDNPPRAQAKFLMTIYIDTVTKVKSQDRGLIYRRPK